MTKKRRAENSSSVESRVKELEEAVLVSNDPTRMAAAVSSRHQTKRFYGYDFSGGLERDLEATRDALRVCCKTTEMVCTFGDLFEYTQGKIANLNRILQNLKETGEVHFDVECFFQGRHDSERIVLLEKFWERSGYRVSCETVYRPGRALVDVPLSDRCGRSYVAENIQTRAIHTCCACGQPIWNEDTERMTMRGRVYHLQCITCAVCGSSPKHKQDYVTYNGNFCCSADCVRRYDAAHVVQQRK
jgi:hypothetical protein